MKENCMNDNYQIEEDEIDLREIFRTIKKNISTVIFIVILSISLTVGYIYFSKNIYSSSTIISLDSKGGGGLGIGAMLSQVGFGAMGLGGGSSGADIEKAKVILLSKKFLKTTLNDLNISRDYFIKKNFRKVEIKEFQNFKIDIEYKDKNLYGEFFKITPIDSKSFLLEIEKINYSKIYSFNKKIDNRYFKLNIKKVDGIDPYDINSSVGNIISKIVDKNFNLEGKSYIFRDLKKDEQIDKLIDNITIEDKKSNILEIKYEGILAKRTKETISIITKSFIDFQLKEKMKELDRNLAIINNQIKNISSNMNKQIKDIERFQEKNNISVNIKGEDIITDIYSKKQELDTLSLQIQEVKNFINNIKNGMVLSVALTSVGIDTISIQKLMDNFISVDDEIRELELQQSNIDKSITSNEQIVSFIEDLKSKKNLLETLLTDFTEEHPQVIKEKIEIENLVNKINTNISINLKKLRKQRNVIKSTILNNISTVENGLYKKLKLLQKDINKKEKLLHSIPANKIASNKLNKTFAFNENIYSALLNKKIDIEIDKSSLIANTKVLEDAYVAEKPDKPKVGLILVVSAVTSFILGIFFIFFREFLNNKIRNIEDIEELTDTPIYGTLPTISNKNLFKEQIRNIKTNIRYYSLDNRCNRVLVTSMKEREGKTTTALNLAIIIAEAGKEVLLIDLNFKNPKLHKELNIDNKIGIVDYLSSNIDESKTIKHIGKNFDFIPIGSTTLNGADFLMGDRFKDLMESLESRYDYIIFDSTTLSSPETKVLFKWSDTILLVVMMNLSEKEQIATFNKIKRDNHLKSVGIVASGKR